MMRSTYRKGAPNDPDRLWALLRSVCGQLGIDWETGLIAPTATGTLYLPIEQVGRVRTATGTPFPLPFACSSMTVVLRLGTSSSSGSVTLRISDGTNNYDTSITSGNTSGTASHTPTWTTSTNITASITAAGTGAANLGGYVALVPA